MITTTAQNGRTLADLTTHAGGPGVSDKLRSFQKPTPMQDFFDVPSHIATDITTIDQHPTDACLSPRLPRALIEGPDKTRRGRTEGLSGYRCKWPNALSLLSGKGHDDRNTGGCESTTTRSG
jgi:hypothetical protein